jgi:Uncharacterized protein conserved in bacteria (DUF2252)
MPRQPDQTSFIRANAAYERWLGALLTLLPADLKRKHAAMAGSAFPFLRATYFRWARTWPLLCPEAAEAPKVLAVGDLHVENFGTWRDIEGRLVWGVNDFDEAWPLPYTNDLVRLATSAMLAAQEAQLSLDPKDICQTLLDGYQAALDEGGRPFVLAEHHGPLRDMASTRQKNPEEFWQKLERMPAVRGTVPTSARKALQRMLPHAELEVRYVHRSSGLGSLGRERFVAIADWHGGKVAREAKALAPSACASIAEAPSTRADIHYQRLLHAAVRCPDPFLHVKRGWIVRRLAPDCSRIELGALPRTRDEVRLLHAMGWETANVHLGSARAKVLQADLTGRADGWLRPAAQRMLHAVEADFEEWRDRHTEREGGVGKGTESGSAIH